MRKVYINPELENEAFFKSSHTNLLGGLDAAGITRSTQNNYGPDLRKWRSFPYYTLNMILENGKGSFRNEAGFQGEVAYGDFFLTFPGVNHLYGPGSEEYWNEMYVSYSGEMFDVYYKQKYFCPEQPVWHLDDPTLWIDRLRKLLRGTRPATKMAVAAETSRFLSLLFEMFDVASPASAGPMHQDWFDKACFLLTRDLRNVDLPVIARELGLSYPSFRLNFTRRAGMPPYQYREQKRIEAAREMLISNPSKLNKEIAFTLGYSRGDHFANQFKKHTGFLPGEYRNEFKRGRKDVKVLL